MIKNILYLVIFLLSLMQAVESEELSNKSFNGVWCGKWDGVFDVCITISDLTKNANYKWKEQVNGKFKKDSKSIERINLNTIKLENIWFVLDEQSLNHAKVIGVFRARSRVAVLTKK